MATTLFSHELRALLCSSCGAPMEVSVAGGEATCAYCGALHRVARRDEGGGARRAEQTPAMGESERLGLLRGQDAAPQPLPPGLEALLHGPDLAPERTGEATALWQASRAAVQRGAPFPDQDRLFFLTLLLAPAVDDRTRRALIESSLELLPDVRHRHVLRCAMAEQAVLARDLEAARRWLAPCDPRPTDLRMDTAYRVAAACLAAAEGAPDRVVALLGSRPGDVPLADDAEAKAELLRADAVERTQGPHAATEQLAGLMLREPRRLDALQRAARELGPLGLCPRSGAAATASLWQTLEARLRPRRATSVGCLVAGSLLPLAGLFLAVGAASGLLARDTDERVVFSFHAMLWLVLVPGGFLLASYFKRRKTLRLRDRGILTVARVRTSTRTTERTKSSTNVYNDLSLEVLVGGRWQATSHRLAREVPVAIGVYPCLADPASPANLVLQVDPL